MCLSVRVALTPPYVQVMQRKTSLSQEQGFAGSNPALHTIYTSDATGRHLRLRTGVLRVRIPPCVPSYTPLAQPEEHLTFNQGAMGSSPIRRTLGVAQLAERRVVAPVVGGSSPLPLSMQPRPAGTELPLITRQT